MVLQDVMNQWLVVTAMDGQQVQVVLDAICVDLVQLEMVLWENILAQITCNRHEFDVLRNE